MKYLFNNMTDIIRAASPSIFAFIETTLPYSTPSPIAIITMTSAGTFFGLKGFGAFLFVYSLEGIGLVATSKLVETIVEFIRGRNLKTAIMIAVLVVVVYFYITILVSLNVKIHTEYEDVNFSQALTLICYLPLIAGVLNGLGQVKNDYLRSQQELKELEERRHQEKRHDTLEMRRLRYQQTTPLPQTPDTRKSSTKTAGDYKEYVFELLENHSSELLDKDGNISLTKITARVNKDKRVQFEHADVKGTWYKYVQTWKSSHRSN